MTSSSFIRTLTSKLFPVEVTSDDTVLTVKEKIRATEGFQPQRQRLILAGADPVTLEDQKLLSEYEIPAEKEIHLVMPMGVNCA